MGVAKLALFLWIQLLRYGHSLTEHLKLTSMEIAMGIILSAVVEAGSNL